MGWAKPKRQWLCKCTCGRKEVILQEWLPHSDYVVRYYHAHYACSRCRKTKNCVVCEKAFLSPKRNKTCSTQCEVIHRRNLGRASYARRKQIDPFIAKRKWDKYKARLQFDPVSADIQS